MAILKNPLFSLKASGPVTQVLSFCRRKNVNIVEKTPVVKDAGSTAQVYHRNMFNLCVDLWHTLSAAEKQVWESAGTARHMTGYAWYISQCLRPNPGIYLPLAGGTMSGDIDMDAHRLLDLPAPLAAQEAAPRSYVDALDRGEGHINILPWNYQSIIQGTWANIKETAYLLNFAWRNTTQNLFDACTYLVYLAAGTYTLRILANTYSSHGIVDFSLDYVVIASFDLYTANAVYNVVFTDTGNVIATPGLKTLRLRLISKNASATSYNAPITAITLWRTA